MTIDLNQFHQAFFEESLEIVEEMEHALLQFNISTPDKDVINQLFRSIHTIKGNSATFGFNVISEFAHAIETLLGRVRSDQYTLTQEDMNFLLQSTDCLRAMVIDLQNHRKIDENQSKQLWEILDGILDTSIKKTSIPEEKQKVQADNKIVGWKINFQPSKTIFNSNFDPYQLFKMLKDFGQLEVKVDTSNFPDFKDFNPKECYLKWKLTLLKTEITESELKELFAWINQDFEMKICPFTNENEQEFPPTPNVPDKSREEIKSSSSMDKPEKELAVADNADQAFSTIRVSVDKIDALINMVGELVITQSILEKESAQLPKKDSEHLLEGLAQLNQNCRELQEKVMRVRMVPISFAFTRFHRMVRDLALKIGKQVELKISGEQTEIDKTMMEKLIDPLTHLVRNSIDHGLETPEKRVAMGKPPIGIIELIAYQKSGQIIICVQDDGAGLNKERILQKAKEQHLIKEDAVLTDDKIYELIFQPGFSTAETVTEISGRGVGMDVVKKNIEALHGTISLYSEPGIKSIITLTFPLTLAIMDCQLVKIGKQIYIIPLISITEIIKIEKNDIHFLEEGGEFYYVRGNYIPVINLAKHLAISSEENDISQKFIIVVSLNKNYYGLIVDDMLSQQQVVIKNLNNCKKSIGISGATVLGDGNVALIIDINGIITLTHSSENKQKIIPDTLSTNATKNIATASFIKEEMQFLIFKLGNNEYGIDMQNVVEIRNLSKITEIPGTAPYIKGVINLRGIIIPVMDLNARFNLDYAKEIKTSPIIIVLKVIHEHHEISMSILVDAVLDTCYAQDYAVTETPDYESSNLRNYLQGLITIGNRMIAILDVGNLILSDA